MSEYLAKRLNYNQLGRNTLTITDRFLLPYLKLNYSQLKQAGYLFGFNGDANRPKKIKKEIVLIFNSNVSNSDIMKELLAHKNFNEQQSKDNLQFFYFDIDKDFQYTVVNKIWRGLYSEINPTYIKENFSKNLYYEGELVESINYQILSKDPKRKGILELQLDCKLPDDAELLSKPQEYKEIYGHKFTPDKDDIRIDSLIKECEKLYENYLIN